MGRITIFVPQGDLLFQTTLGQARRDSVLVYLDHNGVNASRFFADWLMSGDGAGNDTQLESTPSDHEPPKLTVTSTPDKGKRSQPGNGSPSRRS